MKKETIVRTIVLLFALVNQILTIFEINPLPFSEEEVYQFVTVAFTAGASIWAWWKNNSFTAAAIKADEYLAELKTVEPFNEGDGK